ncbi:MAG: hypothetical protein KKH75_03600, partial [Actinobacteria bacterium]|nr:hypothetical protein [Actinomycetota bacterium]
TDRLGRFKTEFEDLGEKTNGVEDAVGSPAGDSRLRDRVGEFESGWNGNREVVQDSLENVYTHLKDFVDQIEALDVELAGGGEK